MLRYFLQRFRFFFHESCGGTLRDRDQKTGVLIWRCYCGVELGRTDLSIASPTFVKPGGRSA